jgi:hypothetical protein
MFYWQRHHEGFERTMYLGLDLGVRGVLFDRINTADELRHYKASSLPVFALMANRNQHNESFDDDDPFDHYSTAGLVELGSNEFPAYFVERDDRLFHSHGNLPYPLPVDTHEQQVCRDACSR